MKKIYFLLFLLFISGQIFAQDIVDKLDMFLSKKYIESNDGMYLYLEISINNRNEDSIFLLKDYSFIKVFEEENGNILYLSSWIDNIDFLKNTSALYHNPRMIEIRSMQVVYVPILIPIQNISESFNKDKTIKRIEGLKYSLDRYITEDISWANNVDDFASNIIKKVYDLEFNHNEYTNKYGNIVLSQIKPPEWMLGTWKTNGKTIPDGEIINSTLRYLKVVPDDIFEGSISTSESIHGWLITRAENTIFQSYDELNYKLDIRFKNGRMDYYHFFMEDGNLIMHHKNYNGLFIFRLERE
ncbi:hypothetical protein [Breznakiella homolactica]|uniref:Uncharacterized protein n=1 Tax=Breznakiella homolactica TaxID=2798577 RepID=A0A7T8BA72_9SPIR|nr:hypothetical protein [Breznakiella homolactica]QQO10369.1 hypothetical protein JFL75_05475 [Breznakiella homolactica]